MGVPFDKIRRIEDLEKQVALLDLAVRQGRREPSGIGKRWVYLAITARESVSYPDGDANTYPIIFLNRESNNTEGKHAADDTELSVDPVTYGRTVNGQPLLEGEVCYAYPLPKPVTDDKCRWVLEPLIKIYWGNLNEELTPGGSAEVSVYTPAGVGPDDWVDSGEDRTVYEVLLADGADAIPTGTKIGFVWYFDRFVMLAGAGAAGLTRFRLSASLSTGGQANAKILTYNGTDYDVSAETITVIDWWGTTGGMPGLSRGMWQGVSGMEGWCRKRERPTDEETPPEQDEYEIVWMEQYARLIEFTLTEGFTAGVSASASVTASWDQGCAPGSTVSIHDPQGRWTDAIEGCKGTAIRDEYADAANPGTPYYRVVSCQRAAKRARATLTAAMCGSTPSVTNWAVYQQGEFVANPGAGTLVNAAGHRGMSGDLIWLERVNNTTPFQWHVVDVEKHALQLLACSTSISGDPAELVKCCITAAVEVCELPACAEEETSSSTNSSFPDIHENSSVYACCEWGDTVETATAATVTVRINGADYYNRAVSIYGESFDIGNPDFVTFPWPSPCFDNCAEEDEFIRLICVSEGTYSGWATDPSGGQLPSGLYLEYKNLSAFAVVNNAYLVPVEVLSCSPLHLRASFNLFGTCPYFFNYGTEMSPSWAAPPRGFAESDCCALIESSLDFDIEITE